MEYKDCWSKRGLDGIKLRQTYVEKNRENMNDLEETVMDILYSVDHDFRKISRNIVPHKKGYGKVPLDKIDKLRNVMRERGFFF